MADYAFGSNPPYALSTAFDSADPPASCDHFVSRKAANVALNYQSCLVNL
jgi:hypothetical protein